jgi:hypothetical protein
MIAMLAFVTIAAAASIVNIYDGLTFLGTTTSDASGSWNFVTAGLSHGARKLAATDAAGNTGAASRPVNRTVVPSNTSFSATSNTTFLIDGIRYRTETEGRSYSLSSPDTNTLRFHGIMVCYWRSA